MYHVSAQGVDERMINVHYYYYIKAINKKKKKTRCPVDSRWADGRRRTEYRQTSRVVEKVNTAGGNWKGKNRHYPLAISLLSDRALGID